MRKHFAARSKYRAVPTTVDGIRFASKHEAKVYGVLTLRQKAKDIKNLKLQVTYPLVVNGQKVCTYVADFVFDERTAGDCDGPGWQEVVCDAKGFKTPAYRLKAKLMKAIHGIEIREVQA